MVILSELITDINSAVDRYVVSLCVQVAGSGVTSYVKNKMTSVIANVVNQSTGTTCITSNDISIISCTDKNIVNVAICPVDSDYQYINMLPWTCCYIIKYMNMVIKVLYDPFRKKCAYVSSKDPGNIYLNGKVFKYKKSPISNTLSTVETGLQKADNDVVYFGSLGYNVINALYGTVGKLIINNDQNDIVSCVCSKLLQLLPGYFEYYLNDALIVDINSGGK